MHIAIKGSPDSRMDPVTNPDRFLSISNLRHRGLYLSWSQKGVIRHMKANEQSKFCAPVGFVPKKSGKLRFVIDFTALNKYVQRPVHSFPLSDQVAQALKASTTHIAAIDFPSGYFQALLHPDS